MTSAPPRPESWIRHWTELIQIDKLNNNNYASEMKDIKFVLMDKNVRRITDGSEVAPDENLFPKEYNESQVRRNKVHATIYLSIEKEFRILISEVDAMVPKYGGSYISISDRILEQE
ncbi:hypothetical protein AVEN_129372-1 [Araneus ventricosus]|uniref:Uncharacterized protein n=1 Tax=Araneus ventricosus TaxID=182803 RepID=A0A4Y2E557_ARAVE|nr:hypothetical protein AVEN_186055-1 [Araneus ventricosus]GBO46808.1 hypothetical protein AVEN_129372-1 [Araneus ventricosus]